MSLLLAQSQLIISPPVSIICCSSRWRECLMRKINLLETSRNVASHFTITTIQRQQRDSHFPGGSQSLGHIIHQQPSALCVCAYVCVTGGCAIQVVLTCVGLKGQNRAFSPWSWSSASWRRRVCRYHFNVPSCSDVQS